MNAFTLMSRLIALMVPMFALTTVQADEYGDWTKNRAARFPVVKAAHPNQDAVIADIKAKTAAMIAAHVRPPGATLDQPPVIWRAIGTPVVVFDDPLAPRMILVPAGEFTMGSPATEPGHMPNEGPRRRVRIAYPLAIGMFPIVVGEYTAFVAESAHKSAASCATLESGQFRSAAGRDWRNPGFPQTMISPVTCLDFNDATAYAAWLSKKTGHNYRLLSEAEYEYANRAGTTTAHWWGDDRNAACEFANGLDQDAQPAIPSSTASTCRDGYSVASPVGKFKPNAFGLFDTTGNVSSWTSDCWSEGYAAAPTDGSAVTGRVCGTRTLRGGSWASADLRSAARRGYPVGYVVSRHGFRIARTL